MIIFLICLQTVFCQQPFLQKSSNNNLSYVLNNTRNTFKSETKVISVKLYQVSNKSGSAKKAGTDEVTDHFYVAISEFDEQPKQMLFVIKNVFAPKNITLIPQPDQKIKLAFVYTDKDQPKNYTAILSSKGVER